MSLPFILASALVVVNLRMPGSTVSILATLSTIAGVSTSLISLVVHLAFMAKRDAVWRVWFASSVWRIPLIYRMICMCWKLSDVSVW